MAAASSLRSYFSWLSPAFRPSSKEVETYARLIAAHEGRTPEDWVECRHQAELQLWVWHNETRRPASNRWRRTAPPTALAS